MINTYSRLSIFFVSINIILYFLALLVCIRSINSYQYYSH